MSLYGGCSLVCLELELEDALQVGLMVRRASGVVCLGSFCNFEVGKL